MPYVKGNIFNSIILRYNEIQNEYNNFDPDINDDEIFDNADRIWKSANSLINEINDMLQGIQLQVSENEEKYKKMVRDLSDICDNVKEGFIKMYNAVKNDLDEKEQSWMKDYEIYKKFIE